MKHLLLYENFNNNDIVLYHGSPIKHDFDGHGTIYYGTFFSKSKNEANTFGKHLYEVKLNNGLKILDTNKLDDVKLIFNNFDELYDTYYNEDSDDYIISKPEQIFGVSDNWEPIENTDGVLEWIMGNYDGIWINEGGVTNLLLFKPVKEKLNYIKEIK